MYEHTTPDDLYDSLEDLKTGERATMPQGSNFADYEAPPKANGSAKVGLNGMEGETGSMWPEGMDVANVINQAGNVYTTHQTQSLAEELKNQPAGPTPNTYQPQVQIPPMPQTVPTNKKLISLLVLGGVAAAGVGAWFYFNKKGRKR